ncbi:hypothetical protein AAG906_016164 [Vitis piasezkii]
MELFKLMGSELHFSTSFHSQTDGQTERVNALLELYLRHFTSVNQKDWAKLLDITHFSYNLQRSEATNKSPFELATRQQPLTPHTLMIGYIGKSPTVFKFAKGFFPILGKVNKVSYKVELPPRLKIHLVFHVSYLKPYHEDKDDPCLRGHLHRSGVPPATEYLVKWKGLPESEASWEPANALWQFQEQIEQFRWKAQQGRLWLRWGRVS